MRYDITIIGCGVVGAAIAYTLSEYDCKVAVLEAENDVAMGTTKANSAILHAGYDPENGTKMARLNVEGVRMAKEICQKLDVPRKEIGSLVLAFSEEEMQHIQVLYERGVKNGVEGLEIITGERVRELEPNVSENVVGALLAPTAAIVCPWEYTLAMAETAVKNGIDLYLNTRVIDIKESDDHWQIETDRGIFASTYVINAAGIAAQKIHEMVADTSFVIQPSRGQYDILDKSEGTRVGHVIFQCPNKDGKGILVSPTVHGNCIVGPTAESVEGNDTATTPDGLKKIAAVSRKSIPSLDLSMVIRNFAGVRANTEKDDFIIEFAKLKFLDVAGIKSPGLSAAPAIGAEVVSILKKDGCILSKKKEYINERIRIRFKELSRAEQNQIVAKDPSYGRIICRCETVTEGEIRAAMHTPIPSQSVDGLKRRLGAGMGRCQGGFCGPRIVSIMAEELGVKETEILQDGKGSYILTGETKGELQ